MSDTTATRWGGFFLKRESEIPSAVSPIVKRTMDEESKAIWHAESNLNIRIIIPSVNNSFSRIVTTSEDPVPCRDASGLQLKELLSQRTAFVDANSPKRSPCNKNDVDTANDSVSTEVGNEPFVACSNDEPVTADIDDTDMDNESITIDSGIDLIVSSDDESISPPRRFDRFSNSDGPILRRKTTINDNLAHTNGGKGTSDSLLEGSRRYESTRDIQELLLEASAEYRLSRKRKIDVTEPNLAKNNQAAALGSPESYETCKTSDPGREEHPAANGVIDLVGTSKTVRNTPVSCRLPLNGHREDYEHFRHCCIVLAGIILRGEHTNWLSDIPSHSDTMQAVNMIIGTSCKDIILSGKCSEEHCTSNIDLNFTIPKESFNSVFNVFTKWFLQNAQQPHLKVILLLLSRAPKDHHNILMVALSFAKMISKFSNRIYRQALSIKLREIMVNTLGYKPWEAVRTLLVFIVTPETELSEISDLLSILEVSSKKSKHPPLKTRIYESVSCLWHINDGFVCPADLIFDVLNECLVQIPVDLKLTRDKMVADMLKLPRKSLRKEFLVIDKFLCKYYPQNSEAAHVVRTSILCNSDVTKSPRGCQSYVTSRVRGTGPVNPQWDYWDIREAQKKGFDCVIKNSQKDELREETDFPQAPIDLPTENFEVDLWRHDLFKIVTNRNILCYNKNSPSYDFSVEKSNDFEHLDDLLISGKYSRVVKIISSCGDSASLEKCLHTLEQKFALGYFGEMAFAILERLPGSLKNKTSVKSCYVRMINSLVVKSYKDSDYKSALKFLKLTRLAGVNHMEYVPEQTDLPTFAVICSDINLQCRLYKEAIRSLQYDDCLNFLADPYAKPGQYNLLEKLSKNMLRRFLKERHASHAVDIFRTIFIAQKSLHFPVDVGKYYEGVIFLSFVSDLKKNACPPGVGANLYTTVERTCGNDEPFHSITYRSLLVELHREKSSEETIRRVLRICLKRKIYPDFSRGPLFPLVLDSHLAKEEISIYLNYYFTYFISRNDLCLLKSRPFVLRFLESPRPDCKAFPIPNDIMKTSRSVPDALDRFKSVLNDLRLTLKADFSQDSVTISMQDVETLIRLFSS